MMQCDFCPRVIQPQIEHHARGSLLACPACGRREHLDGREGWRRVAGVRHERPKVGRIMVAMNDEGAIALQVINRMRQQHVTWEWLAGQIGVSVETIRGWQKNGNVTPSKICRVQAAYTVFQRGARPILTRDRGQPLSPDEAEQALADVRSLIELCGSQRAASRACGVTQKSLIAYCAGKAMPYSCAAERISTALARIKEQGREAVA